jgi:hypothetical protein
MLIQKIIIKTNLFNEFYVIDYHINGNEIRTKIIGEWDEVEKNWTMKYYIDCDNYGCYGGSVYIMYETMNQTDEYEIEHWVNSIQSNGYKYKRIFTLEKDDDGSAQLIEK